VSGIIPLGTVIPPWGTVQAIHSMGGERSYLFINGFGVVSLVPEELVSISTSPNGDFSAFGFETSENEKRG